MAVGNEVKDLQVGDWVIPANAGKKWIFFIQVESTSRLLPPCTGQFDFPSLHAPLRFVGYVVNPRDATFREIVEPICTVLDNILMVQYTEQS